MALSMNGSMPLPQLQLILQLAAKNPDLAARLMAGTGAQPPALPAGATPLPNSPMTVPPPVNAAGNRMTGVPAMAAQMPPAAASTPIAQPTAPSPAQGLADALSGTVPPTQAPGPETLPAPGAPSPGQASGQLGNAAQLMQMLLAAAQKPTDRLSLGRAIQGA